MSTVVSKYTTSTQSVLTDPFGRVMDYLRLAITDRCNLRCQYCMPAEGIPLKQHSHILQYEEMERLIAIFCRLGVSKLRITGGEPFVRKGAMAFMQRLNAIEELKTINLTTNAVLLEPVIPDLQKLKLGSINISIDSLQKTRFREITRRDDFDVVWANIQAAVKAKLPVKLNVVVMTGINDDEISSFCNLAKEWPIDVRFIEQMPFNGGPPADKILDADQIVKRIKKALPDIDNKNVLSSTARIFTHKDFKGRIGVIAGYSRTFCDSCSRIRLTPEGHLKTCLYDRTAVDLRKMIQAGSTDTDLQNAIIDAVSKRAENGFESQKRAEKGPALSMAQIGG